jgi:hypothetical protein
MATVIWFFDQLYVPKELDFNEFAILPLSAEDCALHEAAKSFATHFGVDFKFASWQAPTVDMVAIVQRDIRAATVDEAVSSTAPRALAVASALVYSQFGRGRPLGAFVDLGNGEYEARYVHASYRKLTDVPIVSEQEELLRMMGAFTDHPQAKVLADLFSEACRDPNPSASIVRLWAILEALAERFPGRKHEKVRKALSHLGITNPVARGGMLTQRAYRARKKLMQQGRSDTSAKASSLQAELADLVWFALRRSGLREVDPTQPYTP